MTNNQNKPDNQITGDKILESITAFKNYVLETFSSFSGSTQNGILSGLSVFVIATILNLIVFGTLNFFVTLTVSVLAGLVRYHILSTNERISNLENPSSENDSTSDGTNG